MHTYARTSAAALVTASWIAAISCSPTAPSPRVAPPPASGEPQPPASSRASVSAPAPSASVFLATDASAASTAPPPDSSAPPAAVEEWESPFRFERVLEVPVRSLALGRPPYVAVLSDQPWMMDESGWHELSLPADIKIGSPNSPVAIFFGRDDKPRIMGAQRSVGGSWEAVYDRWHQGRWERDKREIGRLAGAPAAGLYGVLGDEDPEVVCKDGDVCIIKRRTGWKTIPAQKGLLRVWVIAGTAYLLGDGGMNRLEGDGWAELPWSFEGRGKESGFWVDQGQGVWVTAASQNAIYRGQGGRFVRMDAPVAAPSMIWGGSAGDVWVAGSDGVGHFDGTSWKRVKGLAGSFTQVRGRGTTELWAGGAAGLWRGTRQ